MTVYGSLMSEGCALLGVAPSEREFRPCYISWLCRLMPIHADISGPTASLHSVSSLRSQVSACISRLVHKAPMYAVTFGMRAQHPLGT